MVMYASNKQVFNSTAVLVRKIEMCTFVNWNNEKSKSCFNYLHSCIIC